MSPRAENDGAVVQKCLDLLAPLEDGRRARVLRTLATYFDISLTHHVGPLPAAADRTDVSRPIVQIGRSREPVFSGHEPISPKEFLRHKDPKTDVERAMCLAYYLAHYKDIPSFKTADIAKLNTEAAQRKFANTAYTVNNAAATGYFVAASGGSRQLSSMGEQYVETLPDRQAARALMKDGSRRRKLRPISRKR